MLEKTPESRLDSKEIKLVNLMGDQPWILVGRTDTEAPVFWSSDATDDSLDKSLFSIVVAPLYILINSVGGFLFPHTEGTFLDDLQRSLSVSPFLPPPTFSLSLSLFFPPPSFPCFSVQPLPSWYFAPSSFLDVLNLQVWSPHQDFQALFRYHLPALWPGNASWGGHRAHFMHFPSPASESYCFMCLIWFSSCISQDFKLFYTKIL